jgi:hypothetical protein
MSRERIYEALTTGVMKVQGESLSDQQKRVLAELESGARRAPYVRGSESALI